MNKKIIQQPEISYIATGYEQIGDVRYNNNLRYAYAKINLIAEDEQKYDFPELLLWDGDEYDAVGQWTDEDVTNRIEYLLTTEPKIQ